MGDSMQRAYRTTLKHREWAELTARQRSDEIAEKIPQAGEYIRRISRTGSRIARAFQEGKLGNPDFLAKLSEENLDAQNRLALLLVQNGYPENYLDPPYQKQQLHKIMQQLDALNLIRDHGQVILESLKEDEFDEAYHQLHRVKEATYGISRISYYRKETEL